MAAFMTTPSVPTEPEAPQSGTSSSSEKRYIRVGPFQVDLQKEQVTKNGSRLKVCGKAYKALLALMENPGEIVGRDAICKYLWASNSGVDFYTNINTTMNKLRRALGDSFEKPLYIETVPGKGYIFIARSELELAHAPQEAFPANAARETSSNKNPQMAASTQAIAKPRFEFILRVAGLIMLGMLFGAGIVLWVSYYS